MGPYTGHPHEMLAKIRHDELLAEAERYRRMRDLPGQVVVRPSFLRRLRRLARRTVRPRASRGRVAAGGTVAGGVDG